MIRVRLVIPGNQLRALAVAYIGRLPAAYGGGSMDQPSPQSGLEPGEDIYAVAIGELRIERHTVVSETTVMTVHGPCLFRGNEMLYGGRPRYGLVWAKKQILKAHRNPMLLIDLQTGEISRGKPMPPGRLKALDQMLCPVCLPKCKEWRHWFAEGRRTGVPWCECSV